MLRNGVDGARPSTTTRMARGRRTKSNQSAIRPPPRENVEEVRIAETNPLHIDHMSVVNQPPAPSSEEAEMEGRRSNASGDSSAPR
jgi:hypothetical protein